MPIHIMNCQKRQERANKGIGGGGNISTQSPDTRATSNQLGGGDGGNDNFLSPSSMYSSNN